MLNYNYYNIDTANDIIARDQPMTYYNIDTANDIIARDPHVTITYTYIIHIQLPYTLNRVTRYTMVLILDIPQPHPPL